MSDSTSYRLRWRGIESGPFSLSALERQLDEGQIGLWHDVFVQGQWTTIEELFRSIPPSTPVRETKARQRPTASPSDPPPPPNPANKTLPRLHDRTRPNNPRVPRDPAP